MRRILALALALSLSLAACAAPAPQTRSANSGDQVTAAISIESEPEAGFDPVYGWGAGEHVHEPLIQSTLTVTMPDLTIANDLATDFSVSEDALTWRVSIRDDAYFTDEKQLTAKDVAFTYQTVKQESSVNDFTMLREVRVVDDVTLEFVLEHPYSAWPYVMSTIGIVPAHAYDAATYGQAPIGSGRYLLKQWDKGQQAIFEANPNYYGVAPKIRRLTVLFMAEEAAFLAAQAGQVDVAYTAAAYAAQAPSDYSLLVCKTVDNRGFNLPAVAPGAVTAQGVPIGNFVTADPAVRRAMNLGIDRQALIDDVLDGYGTPAYSVCDGLPWQSPQAVVFYDPQQAQQLLDEAGWVRSQDGIRVKDGVRAEFSLVYPAGDSVRQTLAAAVAAQLGTLGIAASPEGVGWDSAYDRALSQPLAWGWGAHTPMELYQLHHTQSESGLALYTPYASEAVDRYMDEALASRDLEQAYTLWQKAQWDGQGGIVQDVPWLWLVNIDHLFWVRDGLTVAEQKIQPHGHGWSILNQIDQWSWKS